MIEFFEVFERPLGQKNRKKLDEAMGRQGEYKGKAKVVHVNDIDLERCLGGTFRRHGYYKLDLGSNAN